MHVHGTVPEEDGLDPGEDDQGRLGIEAKAGAPSKPGTIDADRPHFGVVGTGRLDEE